MELLKEKAIQYLLKDELSYIDMLEPLRRGTAEIIYGENDGVIIYERNSHACMISMQELEKCKSIVNLEKYHSFAVHEKNIAEWIQRKCKFHHRFEAYQAAYRKNEPIAGGFDTIRVLSSEHMNQVCQNYDAMDDRKYIENLINGQQMWGIFDNGILAGFIGEHLEGSMGLLEVLPEYRRKGYGYKLEAFLINHFLKLNETPFCQVITGNAKSFTLQQKLGMDISKLTTNWIFD